MYFDGKIKQYKTQTASKTEDKTCQELETLCGLAAGGGGGWSFSSKTRPRVCLVSVAVAVLSSACKRARSATRYGLSKRGTEKPLQHTLLMPRSPTWPELIRHSSRISRKELLRMVDGANREIYSGFSEELAKKMLRTPMGRSLAWDGY